MGRFALRFLAFASVLFASSYPAFADDPTPQCLDGKVVLPLTTQTVLGWMKTSKDNFLARAHISGRVSDVLPDQTGHDHFLIQIGTAKTDVIEVVYNSEFGDLPDLAAGQEVETCGDYITTRNDPKLHAQAIIHWVHGSDAPKKHESGYVKVDGLVYGLAIPAGGHSAHH